MKFIRTEISPLTAILGFAGITIDQIVDSTETKEYVEELWKVHVQIRDLLKQKDEEETQKYFDWIAAVSKENREALEQERAASVPSNSFIFTKSGILAKKVLRKLAGDA